MNAQIQLLNDEFDDSSTFSNWKNISVTEGWNAEHLELIDINTTKPGKLIMMPYTSTWYANYRGVLIYKEVTGDFVFTTEVTTTNRDENGLPSNDFSLSGPMIRTLRNFTNGADGWTPGGENYIFLSVGQASDNHPSLPVKPTGGPHFEVKTTVNSNSTLEVSGIPTAENVKIRLARVGEYVICLYQLPGGDWKVHKRYHRQDFLPTMQIGFVTYTDWGKASTYQPIFQNSHVLKEGLNPDPSSNPSRPFSPDLIGSFEFARFNEVDVPESLKDANLTSESVSDDSLLSFLGFDSKPVTTSLNGIYDSPKVRVYPNPVDNKLNLTHLKKHNAHKIEVISSGGETVISQTISSGFVDVSKLTKGIYFVKVYTEKGILSNHKFIKI